MFRYIIIIIYEVPTVIRGMNTPYNPKRRKPKKEAYSFVRFCSVSFFYIYIFFFYTKIAQTSHFRYKRPTDIMIQHTPKN